MDLPAEKRVWTNLVTLDANWNCEPDFIADLDKKMLGQRFAPICRRGDLRHLLNDGFFLDDSFDEIHAYEVFEHLGSQGDARAFFVQFSEIWRILKPNGLFFATVPSRFSPWLWGDPSHRRAILPETLMFLDQTQYIAQLDGQRKTSMSDFRAIYTADFHILYSYDDKSHHRFILQAMKPSRFMEKSK